MTRKNGFTLLEVLIVLSIWVILILLVAPINFTHLEKQQEKRFFEMLEFDVLFMQNLSTVTSDVIVLTITKENYIIRGGYGESIVVRDIPPGWDIPSRLNKISFDTSGRVKEPGHFIIKTKHSEYRVILPFGKGRFYIVEQ